MINNKNINHNNFIYKIINNDLKKNKNLSLYTRFPPEPNGHLHIGHAKSICLNFEIANFYKGKCNLRFDDTNPIQEKIKYIKSIQYDVQWLGYKWHNNIKYTSEYFEYLYKYAIELIKKKLAYVDHLTKKEIKEYRGTLTQPGKNSPYRNRTIEENIMLFEKMKNGYFSEGEACLRAKISMHSDSLLMRDPILYRIIFTNHHQTNKKWCIYPMYDFSHCLSDSIENITHSLCTLEFQENKKLYNWILKNTNVQNYPKQYEFSRLNLEYTILSKRKLKILIDKGIIKKWDDPRMPTISGLRKKGYTASSIKQFCQKIGVTKQNNLIEISLLESCIKKELNHCAIRTMAVLEPIKIFLYNLNPHHKEIFTVPNHPKNKDLGNHEIIFTNSLYIERKDFKRQYDNTYKRLKIGHEIRLRYAYIIKAEKIETDQYNNITCIICSCDLNTLGKNSINKKNPAVIHWISDQNTHSAEFRLYNHLFNTKNPENKKDFLSYINPQSLIIKKGFIEKNLAIMIKNDCIEKSFQFERTGYFYIDIETIKKNKFIFHRTVTLKDSIHKKI